MYGFWFEAGPILSVLNEPCKLFKQIFNKDTSLLPWGHSLRESVCFLEKHFLNKTIVYLSSMKGSTYFGGRQSTQPVSWQIPEVPKGMVVGNDNIESQILT